MSQRGLLEDDARYLAAPEEERAAAVATFLRERAPEFVPAAPNATRVWHERTGLAFVLVPGGELRMGITEHDRAALEEEELSLSDVGPAALAAASPVRTVRVQPFLASVSLLSSEDVLRLSDGNLRRDTMSHEQARWVAHRLGLRLPSEAELEWARRDGRRASFTLGVAANLESALSGALRSRFGLEDLLLAEWAEDDWHPSYDGAPATSVPWLGGEPGGVYRGGASLPMQHPTEIIDFLAGLRRQGGEASGLVPDVMMRLAWAPEASVGDE